MLPPCTPAGASYHRLGHELYPVEETSGLAVRRKQSNKRGGHERVH